MNQVRNENAGTTSITLAFVLCRIRCIPSTERHTNKEKVKPVDHQTTAAHWLSVKASETNPYKLIVVKSSHLTRRGRSLAVEKSTKQKHLRPR